ncbi:uncharacterized protein LOC108214347 isoform X2 [Daucus carota subsp. sativus]|uniref:uncharacterized protein LOC108214347 isoform X2 n=1 Tax=Daucus carota subsp. sativus TaxID=79200 RepID=UPI0007F022C7|nr:PREDICTED: uncharacterized protein LOC108214347 isoform X2 [Daucus carota subsp. sativus]
MDLEESINMSIISSSSSSESNSMVAATMGRVMATLLGTRTKKLSDSISRLDYSPKNTLQAVSLEDSLWILYKYVRDSAQGEFSLDHVLVPIIEHSLKCKDIKRRNQTMILLDWLFQDSAIFESLATNFSTILLRKDDHYIALGWCILTRGLLEDDILKEKLSTSGTEKYDSLLRILSPCVKHLIILCSGSISQGGFELPTRLSVAAADCVIALTIALTRKSVLSDFSENKGKSVNRELPNKLTLGRSGASNLKNVKPASISRESSSSTEIGLLLWDLLDEVIVLVQKLSAWSRKSRYLHAKGLDRLSNWLQRTKHHYSCFRADKDQQMVKAGALLFSSCWKHCSVLLHLEDHSFSQNYKELLDHFISGIQFYADNDELKDNKDSGTETLNFFLSCLLLLLGRCNGRQFESAMSEYGLKMCGLLVSQLHSADEDVVDGAMFLIKSVLFGTNSSPAASCLPDTRHIDAIVPSLLHLLDGEDGASKAAATIIAEFCLLSNGNCLKDVLERLAAGTFLQRKNALTVISQLVHMSFDSVDDLSHLPWQDVSDHLLQCLRDDDLVISTQASKLLPLIDPLIVLPPLVHLVYSDKGVQSSACSTILTVLKNHNKRFDVISCLLDCLSNLSEGLDHSDTRSDIKQDGSKLDTDRLLKLIPEWSKTVEDWNLLVGPFVDKMLKEPSNVTIVRFLSCISENLADAADVVFQRLISHAREVKGTLEGEDSGGLQHSLFDHLCPLLIIRLLPLRVFDDLQASSVYGELVERIMMQDYRYFNSSDTDCVASLLLNRAFDRLEYEDVRKLAAELCGRIHHHVLYPIISTQLEDAASSNDVLTIKACLFAICTSLVARGKFSIWHPALLKIREVIETVLLWPSTDGDEVSKAQHGCIDCLALMVCTELQNPKSSRTSSVDDIKVTGNATSSEKAASRIAVHTYVIHQLTCDTNEHISSAKVIVKRRMLEATLAHSFRLCMANVLISACQKISNSGKKSYAQIILPPIIKFVEARSNSEIRSACIQILFSAVYHLKSVIIPYSNDLLKVAVTSLREGSEKERMAGAKLMTALMASDDMVVQSVSPGLLEARSLLLSISSSDASSDLRLVCQRLLLCMTSS